MYDWGLVVLSAFFSAAASVFLKIGAGRVSGGGQSFFDVFHLYIAAVLAYGLGFVAYATALRAGSVSQIYPSMVGITMLLIFLWNVFSGFEVVEGRGVLGAVLVVGGIYMILSSSK